MDRPSLQQYHQKTMRRSEHLLSHSRETAGWATVLFAVAVAIACWTLSAGLAHPILGFAAGIVAALGMFTAIMFTVESVRLRRLSKFEAECERQRAIRPRL